MPVFSIPLSGLTATSTALSAISNNLANLNTVGYKDTRAVFRDLFYQVIGTNGLGNPIQIGAGSAVDSLATVFTGGSVQSTGVPTDVAIMGDGFFVLQRDGAYQFSRAGNFLVDKQGYLSSADGQLVMAYPAVNGVVNTGAALGPLALGKGQQSQPSATTSLQMHTNLNANVNIADAPFSTPITVYDSLGAAHVLTFQFTKSAQGQWDYAITIPAADVGATGAAVTVASGTLSFDSNGRLTSPAGDITNIVVAGLANGASDLSLKWKLYDGNAGMITQMASASNTASTGQDGFGGGTLTDFSIGADGVVEGTFSNGKTMALGQLALANFPNVQGLLRQGNNNFSPTLASGAAVLGPPGTGGRGTLAGGALELSNVDIAREFAEMITAQRGFQANARAITTFDEITQETINLKR
jgi:flagellar hook protein FlgE